MNEQHLKVGIQIQPTDKEASNANRDITDVEKRNYKMLGYPHTYIIYADGYPDNAYVMIEDYVFELEKFNAEN